MQKTILILAANPLDTKPLRLEEELRKIANGLKRAQRGNKFKLRKILATTPVKLRRAILDLHPAIIHFCGHGAGEEGIILEDEYGDSQVVSAAALEGFFELFADKVECVILNACYTEIQAEAIAKHIKYVVGMKRAISDPSAIEFAIALYDALGAGESIEFAYKLACNAIKWENLPESSIPVIKRKSPGKEKLSLTETHMSIASKEDTDIWEWTGEKLVETMVGISFETLAGLTHDDVGDIAHWVPILMDHPHTWRLLITGPGEVVGYWHFIPLFEEEFKKAKDGRLSEGDLTSAMIPLFELPDHYDIYFSTICIKKSLRGIRSTRLLFDALFKLFTDLARNGIFIHEICANAWTPEGEAICKSLKLNYLKPHAKSGKIYYATLKTFLNSEQARRYPDLIKMYSNNKTIR